MLKKFNKFWVSDMQEQLGCFLEYAHKGLGLNLKDLFDAFVKHQYSTDYETNGHYSSYYSGTELVHVIIREVGPPFEELPDNDDYEIQMDEDYWAGWALAYFQWDSAIPYNEIIKYVSIDEIVDMYEDYQKEDIRVFCKRMLELILERRQETKFKRCVDDCHFTLDKIADETGFDIDLLQGFYDGTRLVNELPMKDLIKLINYFGTQFTHLYEYIDDYAPCYDVKKRGFA